MHGAMGLIRRYLQSKEAVKSARSKEAVKSAMQSLMLPLQTLKQEVQVLHNAEKLIDELSHKNRP